MRGTVKACELCTPPSPFSGRKSPSRAEVQLARVFLVFFFGFGWEAYCRDTKNELPYMWAGRWTEKYDWVTEGPSPNQTQDGRGKGFFLWLSRGGEDDGIFARRQMTDNLMLFRLSKRKDERILIVF